MLSRLISLLSRIPAVKWAFNRLRPSRQGFEVAASDSPAIVADIAEPALDANAGIVVATAVAENKADISAIAESPYATEISLGDASSLEAPTEVEAIVAEEVSVAPVDVKSETVDAPEIISSAPPAELPANVEPVVEEVAVSPSEVESAPVDAPELISSEPPTELPADVQPVAVDATPVLPVEAEDQPVEAPELVDTDTPAELPTDLDPVIIEEIPVSSVAIESLPEEVPEPVISNNPSLELPAVIEAVVAEEAQVLSVEADNTPAISLDLVESDDLASGAASEPLPDAIADAEAVSTESAPVTLVEAEVTAVDTSDVAAANDPSPGGAADVVPVAEEAAPAALATITKEVPAASSEATASSEPALVVVPAPPKRSRAPRTPTRAADPADRATLIRQRWAQTGIRMWNPRLHGTGDATLNIQGRSELLPPEPGETLPRYDKLEFKLLGGQIVCEGVIVEAPVAAGQRSFTRLAEPVKPAREQVRERRAALA